MTGLTLSVALLISTQVRLDACEEAAASWLDSQRLSAMLPATIPPPVILQCESESRLWVRLTAVEGSRVRRVDLGSTPPSYRLRTLALVIEDVLRQPVEVEVEAEVPDSSEPRIVWALEARGVGTTFLDSDSLILWGGAASLGVGRGPLTLDLEAGGGAGVWTGDRGRIDVQQVYFTAQPAYGWGWREFRFQLGVPLSGGGMWAQPTAADSVVVGRSLTEGWLGVGLDLTGIWLIGPRWRISVGIESGFRSGGLRLRVDDAVVANLNGVYGQIAIGVGLTL